MRLTGPLEPFKNGAYRRFFLASVIGSICSWIFYTAQTWTFLESSGTAAAVAYLPIVLVIPVPIALVIGGVFTDRRGPKATLILAQGATAVTVGVVGLLDAVHQLTFVPTLATGFLLGVFSGLGSVPASGLLLRIIDRRLVARAFALSLIAVGIGRLVGGTLGGAIVAEFGSVAAFAVAFAGIAAATLIFASLPSVEPLEVGGPQVSRRDLLDALAWARRMPAALALIAADATLAAFIYPYTAVVPVIARDLLRGGAAELGLLISAGGVGALIGGTVLAPLARRFGQGRLLLGAIVIAGAGVGGMAISQSVVVSAAFAAVAGGASISASVTVGLLLQTMAPPRMRGRILALDSVIWNLVNPASLLAVGLLVERIGAAAVILAMAGLAIVAVTSIGLAHPPVTRLDVDAEGELADETNPAGPAKPVGDAG